ncbi:Peptide transporter PTR3-A [Glycine soja]|nr:Peptide transporter PTR3-A [Glycine soja]
MAVIEEKGPSSGNEDYTQDGTVDLKGRPVLRSKTGKWKACSFIVGYEVFERMAFYGIQSNLVIYLTNKLHEGTVTASNNVSNWGMCLLTLAVSLPALRPSPCDQGQNCPRASSLQYGIFFLALYIVAIGTGGTKPNISTMGADQFDEFEPKERSHKLSFFNWWFFSIFFGTLFSNTFLVYLQDNKGWAIGYGLPTLGLVISVVVFLVGTPFYRHKLPSGSPVTRMLQVYVAAGSNWKLHVPDDPKELHELSIEEYASNGRNRIDRSSSLSFLDKAAIKTGQTSPWMLCTVTQVEETKQMTKLIPLLLTTIIPSTLVVQASTLFVKQGTTLDRSMGPHFQIPPACLNAFVTISMLITIVVYDRAFVPAIRRYTKNPRGITMLQRLGIGLVMHVFIMIIACFAERRRLKVARENHLFGLHDTIPLTIFILLPQYALGGVADNFVEVAKIEIFYDQAPDGMKSLGTAYFTTTLGIGSFLSSFLLSTVADVTKRHGHNGWILNNLNVSRLDYYYAFMAVLSFLNFLCFLVVAKFFVYNVDVTQTKSGSEINPSSSQEQDNTGISPSIPQPDGKS